MNHQLQQLVAQTVTHFTSVNMLPINASNIPQNFGYILIHETYDRLILTESKPETETG